MSIWNLVDTSALILWIVSCYNRASIQGPFLCMRPANERRRYNVMSSPIGWAPAQIAPWL